MATRKATHVEEKQAEVVETIAALFTKNVERVADVQKKSLDLAMQQNADVIGALKKIAQVVPGTPIPSVLDLFAHAFGQFVDLQKGAVELAVEQSHTLAGFANERINSFSSATDAVATMVQNTVERTAVAQKSALEFSAAQTRTVIDTFKKQSGVAGTQTEAAADSMQRGFDTLVESQKNILNFASRRSA